MKRIITYFLIVGCILCFTSCSKEKRWIKKELPSLVWNERITEAITSEYATLYEHCYSLIADTLDKKRKEYEVLSRQLYAYNNLMGNLFSNLGMTQSELEKEMNNVLRSITEPVTTRCLMVKDRMNNLVHLKDSSLSESQIDYEQMSAALLNNEGCVDSSARCLITKVLFSIAEPKIKQIKKKDEVWIVTFKDGTIQYVTFSENFSGDLLPSYSPLITDDGKLIAPKAPSISSL